ncbi:hypothetical protein [Vibrio pelagius]|uniref:hypothetical protein n=1 Tax=Vibrio pelagius TaxID=28169 RepID=UPI00355087A9
MKNLIKVVLGVPTEKPEPTESFEIEAKIVSGNVVQMDINSLRKSQKVIHQAAKAVEASNVRAQEPCT